MPEIKSRENTVMKNRFQKSTSKQTEPKTQRNDLQCDPSSMETSEINLRKMEKRLIDDPLNMHMQASF